MNKFTEEFEAQKAARIESFGQDEGFKKSSLAWLEESMRKSYVYNFSCLGRPIFKTRLI